MDSFLGPHLLLSSCGLSSCLFWWFWGWGFWLPPQSLTRLSFSSITLSRIWFWCILRLCFRLSDFAGPASKGSVWTYKLKGETFCIMLTLSAVKYDFFQRHSLARDIMLFTRTSILVHSTKISRSWFC